MRAKLKTIKEELRRRMHQPIPEQGEWLGQVVSGFFNYHAVPTNSRALRLPAPRHRPLAAHACGGAARRIGLTWERMTKLADDWLPKPRSFILGRTIASPSNTRGGSRMRESRTYGSVRGALSNERPYRDIT